MISRKCLDKEWKVQHKWQVKELHGVLSWRPQQRFTAPPEVDDDEHILIHHLWHWQVTYFFSLSFFLFLYNILSCSKNEGGSNPPSTVVLQALTRRLLNKNIFRPTLNLGISNFPTNALKRYDLHKNWEKNTRKSCHFTDSSLKQYCKLLDFVELLYYRFIKTFIWRSHSIHTTIT